MGEKTAKEHQEDGQGHKRKMAPLNLTFALKKKKDIKDF